MYDSISPHLMSVDFFLLKLNNSLCINMIKTCFTKNIKNGNDFSEYRTHIIDKNSPKLTAYHITPKSTNWRDLILIKSTNMGKKVKLHFINYGVTCLFICLRNKENYLRYHHFIIDRNQNLYLCIYMYYFGGETE